MFNRWQFQFYKIYMEFTPKSKNKQLTFQIVSEVQDPPIGSYWGIPFGKLSIPNPIRRTSQCMKDIDPTRSGQNLPCIPLYSANMFVILCVSWTILQIHRQNLCVCVFACSEFYVALYSNFNDYLANYLFCHHHRQTHTHTPPLLHLDCTKRIAKPGPPGVRLDLQQDPQQGVASLGPKSKVHILGSQIQQSLPIWISEYTSFRHLNLVSLQIGDIWCAWW